MHNESCNVFQGGRGLGSQFVRVTEQLLTVRYLLGDVTERVRNTTQYLALAEQHKRGGKEAERNECSDCNERQTHRFENRVHRLHVMNFRPSDPSSQ